jgi:hypothetical protein
LLSANAPDGALYYEAMFALIRACILATILAAQPATAATLSGTVTDASGKPLRDARVDHTGRMVVVAATVLAVAPSPDEIRTDADGHFRVTTSNPAVVVRNPGFASQRVPISGEAHVQITLQPMRLASLCKQSPPPKVKTKKANDVDYTATWFYVGRKMDRKGILSGSGATYSLGAPSDSQVWTSTEYFEVMYESGMIDASGHSRDGRYWRSRTIFGAAAQYFNVTRETAEQLDCVMDNVILH